jgi:hypothetical protein
MRDIIRLVLNDLLALATAAFAYTGGLPAHADPSRGTFVSFDAPGGQRDMIPTGINPAGAIAGTYVIVVNSNLVFLGFLRSPDGTFKTINVSNSTSTFVGSEQTGFAAGPAINPAGAITGSYADESGAVHGFLRASDGGITTFDAPGGVNGTDFVCCITPEEEVVGIYSDANFFAHGFVRTPAGTFTPFDPPGSAITVPGSINPEGAISGTYFDANFILHGFLRAPNGNITTSMSRLPSTVRKLLVSTRQGRLPEPTLT